MNRRRILTFRIASILFILLFIVSQLSAGLIHDGSFENQPTAWEQYFNTACTANSIGDWSSVIGSAGNYDGNRSLWAGGYCNNAVSNNGARQTITLGPDGAILSFWYAPLKTLPDLSNQDKARVFINNDEIWTLTVNGPTGPATWQNALIDISQYAGQEIILSLEMDQNTNALFIANIFYDFIEVYNPAVQITQQVTPPNILVGDPFTVEVTIENSGDVTLNDLAVSNNAFTACNRSAGSLPDLAPGASTSYTCQVLNAAEGMENTATVQATATDINYAVEDENTISPNVINPGLELVVQPDDVTVPEGEQITLDLKVTNKGITPITDIKVTSTPSVCSFTSNNLAPGQTAVFHCTFTPTASGTINFTATAVEPLTNTNLAAETAATIEVEPVDPPTIDTYSLYLPIALNNYTNHNALGEPNNSCSQSFPIGLNQPAQFLAEDVNDWYSFTLDANSSLTASLTNFAPVAGQITIWRGTCGNLTFLGQNGDFATTKTINLTNQPAGSYFVWIINDGPTNTNQKYTLTVATP
ncbi:MAG: hypothetical protein IPM53_09345 [Anaerolineaceae bacterium]|nr:hypothetical protein [Anaerolineaceae bacterium]